MNRAYYSRPVRDFLSENDNAILGQLVQNHGFELDIFQRSAWETQIKILKEALYDVPGYLYFEFSIPRMGKRVDVILLSKGILFVIEFKIGESNYPLYALEQVMDYSLDLKNFHETSHDIPIVPILVATNAKLVEWSFLKYQDNVYEPIRTNSSAINDLVHRCYLKIVSNNFDPLIWESGQYKPTPTIIEAAQALYKNHNVRDITRSDAGAINLKQTSEAIDRIISNTKQDNQKAICFITGVPGSGKTLAGLNIANQRLQTSDDEYAVFLSGNGPLVKVLREALIRDEMSRGINRSIASRKAGAFIQNVHHFRDEYTISPQAPINNVVVFDEAQRAWTREMTASFMKKKRGLINFELSEPEFLISVMDRHTKWAVIICLIGGGQEINTGEAGLSEWFHALNKLFPAWKVYSSERVTDSEYLNSELKEGIITDKRITLEDRLHLSVSVRSYRSEKVSALIKSILDCELQEAKILAEEISENYPIFITREIDKARTWLQKKARGSERFGLLASSGADRLRPEGIFVNAEIEVEHWFLDNREDVRSSFFLEGVATEFDIQGLELDWAAIAWDADLRYLDKEWDYKAFKGNKWLSVRDPIRRHYLINAYRVLLTRARQGMVIFVPRGNPEDLTRLPDYYDGTFNYLQQIGFEVI